MFRNPCILFLTRLATLLRSVVLPKLYSNTLLVSLNNRAFIRGHEAGRGTPSLQSNGTTLNSVGPRQHKIRIGVAEERLVTRDTLDTAKPGLELMPIDGLHSGQASQSGHYRV